MVHDLERRLAELPATANPATAAEIVARVHRRRRHRHYGRAAVGVAIAAGVVALIPGTAPEVRPRGIGAGLPAPVVIEAVAEGPAGARPVADGGILDREESVVFRIATPTAGTLTLAADGTPIWPSAGEWRVDPGVHYLGGDTPLAWTPDGDRLGAHAIVATLCPLGGSEGCTSTTFVVRWQR